MRVTKSRILFSALLCGATAVCGNAALAQQYQVLYVFQVPPERPDGGVIQGNDGNFYGTTYSGGANGYGIAFKMDSSGNVTVLHSFAGQPSDAGNPVAGLIQGSDGNFYGTTLYGGANDDGTVFKMDSSGNVTVLHSFAFALGNNSDGGNPRDGLTQGSDGNFYGTTGSGGANGYGIAFKMDSSGNVTVLHSFAGGTSDGAGPGGLVQGSDGNFYGTTGSGGANNLGTVFKMDSSGTVTVLHSFSGQPLDGANPEARLIQGSDGNFYGTTGSGGANGVGTVFKMQILLGTVDVITVLHSFSGYPSDGSTPSAGLIQGSDGNFYGTTLGGGANDLGTVFKLDSSGNVTQLHSFSGQPLDGAVLSAGLIQGSDGNFYGTTVGGGTPSTYNPNGSGTVFKMNSSGNVALLHSFGGPPPPHGEIPAARLIQGSDGSFYGTTIYGGANDVGTVFKMDSSGMLAVSHSFAGGTTDGMNPAAGLIQGSDGNFYGTTYYGGTSDLGTVFRMDSSGTVTVLHSFSGQPLDGADPKADLMQGSDGNFYGTTVFGGANDVGTVFKMDSSGKVTTLHSFGGPSPDGGNPVTGLIQGSDGNFYGTTAYGGANDDGTVFKMDSLGNVTTLHSFSGQPSDGGNPAAGLIQGSDGNFYGTTEYGGANDDGTVFKMDSLGNVTVLHSFARGTSDGAYPSGRLVQGSDGNFYGTTYRGGTNNNGANDNGTVFKMDSLGNVTVLHSLTGADGANPITGLIQGSDGNFYGATAYGGAADIGTVFRISIPAVQVLSVVSELTHGSAGTFDITLPLTGNPGIECRSSSSLGAGNYLVIFTFANNLASVGGESVMSGAGTVSSSAIGPNPNQYSVNLTGVRNAQVITVSLNNVSDSAGNFSSAVSAQMGVLLGDVNASGRVDAADVSLVRQQTLQPVTSSNFREDVNASGRIDAADVSIARQQTLTSLP
jgi:uncharacterized repeat protein (TIGR03803 family)